MNLKYNTVGELLSEGKSYLKKQGVASFVLDAQLLCMAVLHCPKIELYTKDEMSVTKDQVETYEAFLKRRAKQEPIQYILNQCEFMGLDFYVDPAVLIPRADTEILVERVLAQLKINKNAHILEIGVGSGCISISLAHYCKEVSIVGVDISREALLVALQNAKQHQVLDQISFVSSDLFEQIQDQTFDIIVSNPPYIESETIATLEDNVKEYEPWLALDGGVDGLDFYRKIIEGAEKALVADGFLLFEIGYNQADALRAILEASSFHNIEILKDYAQQDRVVVAQKSRIRF